MTRYYIVDCDENGFPIKYICHICSLEFTRLGIMNHKKGCRKNKKNQYTKS